jgi:hypothetical protein
MDELEFQAGRGRGRIGFADIAIFNRLGIPIAARMYEDNVGRLCIELTKVGEKEQIVCSPLLS